MKRLYTTSLLSMTALVTMAQLSFTLDNSYASIGTNLLPPCVVDMNGDGLDDFVQVNSSSELVIHYQQAGGGPFSSTTFSAVTAGGVWSVAAADIDGNGYNDLVIGNGNMVTFVHANATGTAYTDDPRPEYIFSQRSNFVDINNDGHLDAFVCHDVDMSHPYRNDGTGNLILDQTFINELSPYRGNYASLWLDIDNDRDIDLYVTKCVGGAPVGDTARTNILYINDGTGFHTEMAWEHGMADNAQGWATAFADYDNDGDFDGWVLNHDMSHRFWENDGAGNMTDVIGTSGIPSGPHGGWEADCYDLDNDGWVDIVSDDPGIYLNDGDGTFTPWAGSGNNDSFGVGDFNNDGFLDYYDEYQGGFFINDGNSNHWIKMNMTGTVSNRSAIGTRVELIGPWGTQIREVRSGTSFTPMCSMTLHFGLGAETVIDTMRVCWPSGLTEEQYNVPADQTLDLIEGSVGITEHDELYDMIISPNPAQDGFTIEIDENAFNGIFNRKISLVIYDAAGREVRHTAAVPNSTYTVQRGDLDAGMYYVQLRDGATPISISKVVFK